MEELATNLRRLLAHKRLDAAKLAKKSRVSPKTIRRILCGKTKQPQAGTLDLLAKALATTVEELLAPAPQTAARAPDRFDESEQAAFRSRQLRALREWRDEPVFKAASEVGLELPRMRLGQIYVEPEILIEEQPRPVLDGLLDLIAVHPVVVVFADFGMGKSLTARMLASRLAAMASTDEPGSRPWFPMFATCLDVLLGDPRCTPEVLDARVAVAMERALGLDWSLDEVTRLAAIDGLRVTILDGFDEVPLDGEASDRFFRLLRDTSSSDRRFIVFSRPAALPKLLSEMGVYPDVAFGQAARA